jgi:hypothetical protein
MKGIVIPAKAGKGIVIPAKAGIHFAVVVASNVQEKSQQQGQNGSRLAPG